MFSFYDWRDNLTESRNSKTRTELVAPWGAGPRFETLENRCLLSTLNIVTSGSGSAQPGPLVYVELDSGTANPNELSIVSSGPNGTYTITDRFQPIELSGTAMSLGWSNSGPNTVTGPVSSVTSLAISSSNNQVNNLTIGSVMRPRS